MIDNPERESERILEEIKQIGFILKNKRISLPEKTSQALVAKTSPFPMWASLISDMERGDPTRVTFKNYLNVCSALGLKTSEVMARAEREAYLVMKERYGGPMTFKDKMDDLINEKDPKVLRIKTLQIALDALKGDDYA